MKKISHKERIQLAKKSVVKTKKKQKNKISSKSLKKIKLIGGISVIGGISAGVGLILNKEIHQNKQSKYAIINDATSVEGYVYKNRKDILPKFVTEKNGSQIVYKASQGPVKFISNYPELFSKEKLEDFLAWFYNDISWGPEIASLSSINFLSGVQTNSGSVTLGYHTTSREGSTIVMSPDVEFNNNKEKHIFQSICYALINHPNFGPEARSFFNLDNNKNDTDYRKAVDSDFFNKVIKNVYDNSLQSVMDVVYQKDSSGEYIISKESDGSLKDPDKIDDKDYQNLTYFKKPYPILQATDLILKTLNDNPKISDAKGMRMINLLLKTDYDTNNKSNFNFFKKFISSNTFKYLSSINNWRIEPGKKSQTGEIETPSDFDGEMGKYFSNNKDEIKKLVVDFLHSPQIHLKTQASTARFANKKEVIENLFEKLLITSNLINKTNKNKKINSILSVLYFYFHRNGTIANRWMEGHKLSYGHSVIKDTYNKLKNMSGDKINNISGKFLYKQIFEQEAVGEYDSNDVKKIKNLFSSQQKELTKLSKYLQEKYKPGELDNSGSRIPGMPVWKKDDSVFDAITRRISQDMSYTISHEYGHHTTMWYAQDLSMMNSLKDIGPNNPDINPNNQSKVVVNSEVLTDPSLNSLVSGSKYKLFREGFSSNYFKKLLDESSDGSSRTDLLSQKYKDEFTFGKADGYLKEIKIDKFYNGIDSIFHRNKNISSKFISLFSKGKDDTFGFKKELESIVDVLFKKIKSQQDSAKNTLQESDFENKIDNEFIESLKKQLPQTPKPTKENFKNLVEESLGDYAKNLIDLIDILKHHYKHDELMQSFLDKVISLNDGIKTHKEVLIESIKSFSADKWFDFFTKIYLLFQESGLYTNENFVNIFYLIKGLNELKLIDNDTSKVVDNNVIALTSKIINNFDDNTGVFTTKDEYTINGQAAYLLKIWNAATAKVKEIDNLNHVTGEIILRALMEQIATDSRELFDQIINQNKQNISELGYQPQIDIYKKLVEFITYGAKKAKTIDEFKTNLKEWVKEQKISFEDSFFDSLAEKIKQGVMFFTLPNGINSPSAVIYMFNKENDEALFKTHISTAVKGTTPPSSFHRYYLTYAESLTRAWNQLSFAPEAELLTQPGSYYEDDPAAFAAAGELFYNIRKGGDRKINESGIKLKEMFAKYFNTDKEISTIIRNRRSGLYTFVGYSNNEDQYDKIVFIDPKSDNVIQSMDMIYGVDNLHYYEEHGNNETKKNLHSDRVSWMTDFSVLGGFTNSKLQPGNYKVSFWKDKNGDNEIQKSELKKVLNSEVPENGQFNNNGKVDKSAEIIGNPNNKGTNQQFIIRVGDIKV